MSMIIPYAHTHTVCEDPFNNHDATAMHAYSELTWMLAFLTTSKPKIKNPVYHLMISKVYLSSQTRVRAAQSLLRPGFIFLRLSR
jgi:hypothetical protein